MGQQDWFSKQTENGHSNLSDVSGSMPDGEFNGKTLRLAQMLDERLPARHSPVGLWGENSLDYLVALFAVLRSGHVAVPLNTRLSSRELADITAAAGLQTLLAARDFPQGHRQAMGNVPIFALNQKVQPLDPTARQPRLRELADKDVAVLVCSSGSSGKAKIVPLSLKSLQSHARAVCTHLGVTWHDRWVCCLPFYHVGGLSIPFRCLVSGASLSVSASSDADEINRLIDHDKATLVSVVPTTFERMVNRRAGAPYPQALRAIIVGGGPVPEALLARCERAYATYGLTEAGSMVTCARPGCGDAERKTAGPALPGTELKLVNADGKEVKSGEAGQILVKGPGLTQGYVGDSAANRTTFKGGWLHTGDIGRLDAQGFLRVEARRGDVVLSGGENVYPAEIEAVIKAHPRVQSVVVLPILDAEWGQTPAAFIVLSPGRPLEKVHIFHFLEDKLARYKFPRKIVFAPELPLLSNGKPDLAKIRQALIKG